MARLNRHGESMVRWERTDKWGTERRVLCCDGAVLQSKPSGGYKILESPPRAKERRVLKRDGNWDAYIQTRLVQFHREFLRYGFKRVG